MTALDGALAGFDVNVSFVGEQALLAILGEVDILAAAELGTILDVAIERGYRCVVLDLDELDFMDAAGLRVVVSGADRLETLGGSLTIRTPSAMDRRLRDITSVAGVARSEQPEPALGSHGPEVSVDPFGVPVTTGTYGLTQDLRRGTTIPYDDGMVDGPLRLVVALARATVGAADGVSVSLRRHGCLATVAASDQTILDMDANQYDTGEGPCVDASVEGRWFHVESVDTETRWPAFTPRAQALGINSILSSPLLVREKPVGALNIYSRTTAAFQPTDQELASVFATETSIILTDAGLGV